MSSLDAQTPKQPLVSPTDSPIVDMPPTQIIVSSLEAQTPSQPVVEEDPLLIALSLPQQRLFRAKFLGYFALHTLVAGLTAAMMELNPKVNKRVQKSVLAHRVGWILSSVCVAILLLVATALDDMFPKPWRVTLVLLGSMSLGMSYACIDVATDSYGMLLNTGFMFVCVLLMIPISFFGWLKPGDAYKRLMEAIPAAAIAYVITVVISIVLFLRVGRDLLTVQGFCVSMASQLVGVLLFSAIVHLAYDSVTRREAMLSISMVYGGPFVLIGSFFGAL